MNTSRIKKQFVATLAAISLIGMASAEHSLPSSYEQLDWVQSFGASSIDTGYKPLCSTPFVVETEGNFTKDTTEDFQTMGTLTKGAPATGRYDWGVTWQSLGPSWAFTNKENKDDTALSDLNNHVFIADFGSGATPGSFTVDGKVLATVDGRTQDSGNGYTFYLFARHGTGWDAGTGSKCNFRMRRCQMRQGGVIVRDYVPCRSPEGTAGLWEKVEGKFCTSSGLKGSDEFVFLNYIESTVSGKQYIDTGYKPLSSTPFVVETEGNFTADYTGNYQIMGALANAATERYDWGITWPNNGRNWAFVDLDKTADTASGDLNNHVFIADFGAGATDGSFAVDGKVVASVPGRTKDSAYTFNLFARNGASRGCYCNFRMRRCQMRQGGVVVRDFRPMRDLDGKIGLYDSVGKKLYSGSFNWNGFTYTTNETALLVREGKFAANENFASTGFDSVEKVGRLSIDASACVSYPADLKLTKGNFSLQDGQVKSYTVNGTLAFAGGATLKIDATSAACDTFNVSSLDLTGATSANPFMIDISNKGAGTDWASGETLTLVTGTGLADGICGNIRVTQSGVEELVAAVKDDNLIILRKPAPHAIWTGAAGNYDFTDPGNWEYFDEYNVKQDRAPDANTDVYFNGSDVPDITGSATFAAKSLILSATLAGDRDWSGLAATIPVSGKIDLKGNKLTVANLPETWDAEITDTGATVYERLEYIQSSVSGKQYVDTKYTPLSSTPFVVETEGNFTANYNNDFQIMGTLSSTATERYDWGITNPKFGPSWAFTNKENKDDTALGDLNNHVFIADFGAGETAGSFAVDGKEVATVQGRTKDSAYTFCLFARNKGASCGCYCNFRMRRCQMRQGGVVVRDFVPAKRVGDGKIGLLDLAHLGTDTEFYVNKSTTAFTAGATTGYIAVTPGELHVNVAKDAIVENTTVTLSGSLKLVKEGEGTLVTMDATQTYVGGTDILGGTVKLGGSSYLGPQKSPVTVYEGAVLDIGAGNHRRWTHPVLAGGTLRNSEKDVGSDQEQHSVIVLTENSSIDFTWNGGMIGSNYAPTTLDLGENELDLTVASGKSFYLDNADVSAGLLKLSGGGTLAIDKTKLRAASADFDIASKVTVAVSAEVHDWTVREGATVSGNGTITVNGTYRPDVDTAAKYALKAGSTLDLGSRSTALNAANLTFPNGTVYIDLGTRKAKAGQLISWEEGKGPANVTFKLSPDSVTRGCLEVRNDGLYIKYGMLLIFM